MINNSINMAIARLNETWTKILDKSMFAEKAVNVYLAVLRVFTLPSFKVSLKEYSDIEACNHPRTF